MNEMNILVTTPVEQRHKERLTAAAPDAAFIYKRADEVTEGDVAVADVIFGNIKPELLKAATPGRLKLVQLFTAGSDGYVNALPEGARLTNTTGAFGLAISEHMLAMLLMLKKRLHEYRDNQMNCEWKDMGTVTSIEDSTIVIIGLGDIGGEFARKAKALGAYTIGVRRKDMRKPDYIDELVLTDNLDSVLPRADAVAMALPNMPTTYQLLDRSRIGLLKDGAIVLNVGRGQTIDTEALCDELATGRIMAGLDVVDPEPLPADHRLWKMKNAIVTPHISGFFHLQQTHDRMVRIAAENIKRLREGRELINIIDSETGYCKK